MTSSSGAPSRQGATPSQSVPAGRGSAPGGRPKELNFAGGLPGPAAIHRTRRGSRLPLPPPVWIRGAGHRRVVRHQPRSRASSLLAPGECAPPRCERRGGCRAGAVATASIGPSAASWSRRPKRRPLHPEGLPTSSHETEPVWACLSSTLSRGNPRRGPEKRTPPFYKAGRFWRRQEATRLHYVDRVAVWTTPFGEGIRTAYEGELTKNQLRRRGLSRDHRTGRRFASAERSSAPSCGSTRIARATSPPRKSIESAKRTESGPPNGCFSMTSKLSPGDMPRSAR